MRWEHRRRGGGLEHHDLDMALRVDGYGEITATLQKDQNNGIWYWLEKDRSFVTEQDAKTAVERVEGPQ